MTGGGGTPSLSPHLPECRWSLCPQALGASIKHLVLGQTSSPLPLAAPTSGIAMKNKRSLRLAFSISSSGCLAQGASAASWAAGFPPVGRGVGPAGTLPEGPGLWVTGAGQPGTTQIGGYGESVPRHLPSWQSAIGVLSDPPCPVHTAWLPVSAAPHAQAPSSL